MDDQRYHRDTWRRKSISRRLRSQGVAPDVEVDYDPKAVRAGRDPQLEKAVEVVLEELKKNPPKEYRRPAYPNYHGKK